MTASDQPSPATVRSAGQEPPLLPPAVRQALEHPGPFALGLDAWEEPPGRERPLAEILEEL